MSIESKLKEIKTKLDSMPDSETKRQMLERTNEHLAKYDGRDKVVSSFDVYEEIKDRPTILPMKTNHDKLDRIIKGFYPKQCIYLGAPPASGKAQTLDSKVLTENGFINMGDVKIGDSVIGSNGRSTNVVGVFPQGIRPVYEFTFSDGSKVKADEEHLWNVQSQNQRKGSGNSHVLSTLEIINYMDKYNNSLYIPLVKPVKLKQRGKITIEPYTLGVLIGDGCFDSGITIMNTEKDILNKIDNLNPRKEKHHYGVIGMKHRIDEVGLGNKKSYEKFIPEQYKYTSVKNRRYILAGLIDTDGSVAVKGNGYGASYEYSTTSEQLALDVQFIVQSLGGTAQIKKRKGRYKKDGVYIEARDYYRVCVRPAENDYYHSSEKHSARYKQFRRGATRSIESIKYVGKEETQCIKVSAEDSLYVTDEFIVTHNTSFVLDLIDRMKEQNPLFISLEQSVEELVSTLAERKLDIPFFVTPRHKKLETINWISDKITEAVIKHDSKVVFIDHFGYLKNDGSFFSETKQITATLMELEAIADELDVAIVTIVHIRKTKPTDIPTKEDLQGSAGFDQQADTIIMMWREAYLDGKETKWSNKVLLSVQKNRKHGENGSFRMKYKDYKFIQDDNIVFNYEDNGASDAIDNEFGK